MVSECAEVGVLYNDAEMYGVRFHKVPRSLFDLIPGQAVAFATAFRPYWTKIMYLADGVGNNLKVTMYCDEAPAPTPTLPRDDDDDVAVEGDGALLREPEQAGGDYVSLLLVG